jgi:hypothetical protein
VILSPAPLAKIARRFVGLDVYQGQTPGAIKMTSRLFEIASVLVLLNHVAHCIVNANHSIGKTATHLRM